MPRVLRRLLLPAAAALVLAGTAQAADVSSNWSGYAVSGSDPATGVATQFTSVTGTWTQPKAACTGRANTYSAFWVGLGGYADGSQALEQIGTSSDCSRTGTPVYSVWYELVPAAAVPVKLKLFPGNQVRATVIVTDTTVTVRLDNLTRKTFFQKRLVATQLDLTSAEWVAEAPSSCTTRRCTVLPLANFGSVAFTQATATADGHTGTISDPAWAPSAIWLIPGESDRFFAPATTTGGAVPGTLSADGTSFSVAWHETVTPPPDTPVPPTTPTTPTEPAPAP
jgi:hypothetical protein